MHGMERSIYFPNHCYLLGGMGHKWLVKIVYALPTAHVWYQHYLPRLLHTHTACMLGPCRHKQTKPTRFINVTYVRLGPNPNWKLLYWGTPLSKQARLLEVSWRVPQASFFLPLRPLGCGPYFLIPFLNPFLIPTFIFHTSLLYSPEHMVLSFRELIQFKAQRFPNGPPEINCARSHFLHLCLPLPDKSS